MNLKDKLLEKMILNPLQAQTKESAIQELLTHLESLNILSGTNQLYTNIQEQERHFTSSAGRGIAYPHSISIDIDKLVCIPLIFVCIISKFDFNNAIFSFSSCKSVVINLFSSSYLSSAYWILDIIYLLK